MRKINMIEPIDPPFLQTAVTGSAVVIDKKLYDEIFCFIDCVRSVTMNKQTFDEALIILKKMIDAKI